MSGGQLRLAFPFQNFTKRDHSRGVSCLPLDQVMFLRLTRVVCVGSFIFLSHFPSWENHDILIHSLGKGFSC